MDSLKFAISNTANSAEFSKTIKLLFFTSSLGVGGAEMHLLRVLNNLDRSQFQISVALARRGGSYESDLAEDVKLYHLETGTINSSTLRMLRAIQPLRRTISNEQPDILCSVLDHANNAAVLATCRLASPPNLVLSVQNTQTLSNKGSLVGRLLLWSTPRLYPKADRIVALSKGVAEDIKTLVPDLNDSIEVIYNAGLDSRVFELANEPLPSENLPKNSPLIVACGRLTEQKGFSYLLEALVQVRQRIPVHLWIVGEGKLRQHLEQQIQRLGLTDCVRLLGFQHNPYQYMASADIFVLSSLYEGFGNVIVEAMACGAPVVATDCPSGPAEIIENGLNGILAPPANADALSEGILRVLTDPKLKATLSQKGKERSRDFHAQTIANAYGNLFQRMLST